MSATPPTTDHSFKVKEDVTLNFLVGGLCLVFVVVSVVNWSNDFINYLSILFFLAPAVFFIAKGIKNRTIITINAKGIFYHGRLVTNWETYYKAYISEDQKLASISDNFVLIIKCYDAEKEKFYERKIKLSNTQSKSEEAIIGAINYYNKLGKEGLGR
jgi:hypothetical protein